MADEVLTVAKLPQDVYCTDIHWYPAAAVGTKKQSVQSELFVLACTDGECAVCMSIILCKLVVTRRVAQCILW